MAISAITIEQDNKVGNSDLLPVHSPLVFIVNVAYDGISPTVIYTDVEVDGLVVETFKMIPYKDPLETLRQFCFVSNDVIKGLMDPFDDTFQTMESLVHIPEITKRCKLTFYEPENKATMFAETTVTFAHGAVQFGDEPNLRAIYQSDTNTYLGAVGEIVYVYFYNEDPANELTIGAPQIMQAVAVDYDDTPFADYDYVKFIIDVAL